MQGALDAVLSYPTLRQAILSYSPAPTPLAALDSSEPSTVLPPPAQAAPTLPQAPVSSSHPLHPLPTGPPPKWSDLYAEAKSSTSSTCTKCSSFLAGDVTGQELFASTPKTLSHLHRLCDTLGSSGGGVSAVRGRPEDGYTQVALLGQKLAGGVASCLEACLYRASPPGVVECIGVAGALQAVQGWAQGGGLPAPQRATVSQAISGGSMHGGEEDTPPWSWVLTLAAFKQGWPISTSTPSGGDALLTYLTAGATPFLNTLLVSTITGAAGGEAVSLGDALSRPWGRTGKDLGGYLQGALLHHVATSLYATHLVLPPTPSSLELYAKCGGSSVGGGGGGLKGAEVPSTLLPLLLQLGAPMATYERALIQVVWEDSRLATLFTPTLLPFGGATTAAGIAAGATPRGPSSTTDATSSTHGAVRGIAGELLWRAMEGAVGRWGGLVAVEEEEEEEGEGGGSSIISSSPAKGVLQAVAAQVCGCIETACIDALSGAFGSGGSSGSSSSGSGGVGRKSDPTPTLKHSHSSSSSSSSSSSAATITSTTPVFQGSNSNTSPAALASASLTRVKSALHLPLPGPSTLAKLVEGLLLTQTILDAPGSERLGEWLEVGRAVVSVAKQGPWGTTATALTSLVLQGCVKGEGHTTTGFTLPLALADGLTALAHALLAPLAAGVVLLCVPPSVGEGGREGVSLAATLGGGRGGGGGGAAQDDLNMVLNLLGVGNGGDGSGSGSQGDHHIPPWKAHFFELLDRALKAV